MGSLRVWGPGPLGSRAQFLEVVRGACEIDYIARPRAFLVLLHHVAAF